MMDFDNTGFASKYSRLLVTAEQHDGGNMVANRTEYREWEHFTFEPIDPGRHIYAIKSRFSNLYVSAFEIQIIGTHLEMMVANTNSVSSDAQKFELNVIVPPAFGEEGTFALRSIALNKWVAADQVQGGRLNPNRTSIGPWEEFFFHDGSISLRPILS